MTLKFPAVVSFSILLLCSMKLVAADITLDTVIKHNDANIGTLTSMNVLQKENGHAVKVESLSVRIQTNQGLYEYEKKSKELYDSNKMNSPVVDSEIYEVIIAYGLGSSHVTQQNEKSVREFFYYSIKTLDMSDLLPLDESKIDESKISIVGNTVSYSLLIPKFEDVQNLTMTFKLVVNDDPLFIMTLENEDFLLQVMIKGVTSFDLSTVDLSDITVLRLENSERVTVWQEYPHVDMRQELKQ